MGAQMDRLMSLAKYQVDRMKDLSEKFYLLNDMPECVNVCFWYIPPRLRDVPHSKEKEAELGKVPVQYVPRIPLEFLKRHQFWINVSIIQYSVLFLTIITDPWDGMHKQNVGIT